MFGISRRKLFVSYGGSFSFHTQNVVFEALSFISAYYAGLLSLNEGSGPLVVAPGSIIVGTILYLNDTL